MCKCGVEASYGLVPSGLGIGHFCGHMIDYDESTQKCKWESSDDVFKFKDEYKARVAVRKTRGYPANYVTDFVKDHKKKMLAFAQELRVRNPASIAWKKWSEEREKEIEEYRARKAEEDARKAAEEAERAEMQCLNDTIASLCAKIGCTGNWQADVGRAKYAENMILGREAAVGGTASRPIVVEEEDEAEEDDDTGRIGDLIRLAEELGYPQDEHDYEMGRIGDLLRLAEEGEASGPMPVGALEEGEAAYHNQKTSVYDSWWPTDMTEEEGQLYSQAAEEAEAAYYERQASEGKAAEASMGKEVVVDDWESEDELLTQWCMQFD
ncbi:uncharacterized protein LOC110434808 [Sorghum bicolor]|uniref:uncharacterized protein LOC110434808 n=1 Tax=Sorghum bicolor TaxID=4558 RepID=UPI000B424366|nr:uncharacterized protein LOC110434808 [Sorghum bicolor]|eukprot:XP_021315211.1 uncharacterized protein LOC110434808 [Sorghum bicolor]